MAEREVCLWETEAGERGAVQAVPGEGASDEAASEAGGVMMAHLVIDALRQQVATLEEDETRGMTDERYDYQAHSMELQRNLGLMETTPGGGDQPRAGAQMKEQKNDWQPIETAPRTNSRRRVIDVWCVTDDHEAAKFYFGNTMSGVKDQMMWQGRVSEVYWVWGYIEDPHAVSERKDA